MTHGKRLKVLGSAMALVGVATAFMFVRSPGAKAWDDDGEDKLVKIGFEIAPVPLNLQGKNHDLVGLGSFIVNAQGDCNGCHTAGGPPNFNYANNGNPYFGQKQKTDPTTYLAGGSDFGKAVPPSAAVGGFPPGSVPPSYPPNGYPTDPNSGLPYVGPDIISRNLTPDKNGRPEGGHTLEEFKQILRKGTDFDAYPSDLSVRHGPQYRAGHLHPADRQRKSSASHALAGISEHDRAVDRSHLRVSKRDSLHRQ